MDKSTRGCFPQSPSSSLSKDSESESSPSNESPSSPSSSNKFDKIEYSLEGSVKAIRGDGVVKSFESFPPPSSHSPSPGEDLLPDHQKGGSGENLSPGGSSLCSIPKHTPSGVDREDSGSLGGGSLPDPRPPSEIEIPGGEVGDLWELEGLIDVARREVCNYNSFVVTDDRFELVNPGSGYYEVLESMGFDSRRAGAHIEDFHVWFCRFCGKFHYFPRVEKDREAKGLGVSLNPYTALHSSRTSAGRTMGDLEGLDRYLDFDLYVSPLVLTFPKGLSKRLESMGRESIGESWDVFKRFRDYLEGELTKQDSKLGMSNSLHLWKSSNPLSPHYHFHSTLLNVAVGTNENGVRQFHRIKPLSSVNESDRELVRDCWRKALEDVFPGFMEGFEKDLNIWIYPDLEDFEGSPYWKVCRDESQIKHWLRYCRRGYALDLGKFVMENEYSGEDLTNKMKEFGRVCMNYTHSNRNNARPYGWWISPGMCRVLSDARARFELENSDVDIRRMCEGEVYTNWNYEDREKLRHLILQYGRVSMGELREFCRFYLDMDWEKENVKKFFLLLDVCKWDKENGEFCLVYPEDLDNKGERGNWREEELVKIECRGFERHYCVFCGEELLDLEKEVDCVPSDAVLVRKGDVIGSG